MTKETDPSKRPEGVTDFWTITIGLWNDGPSCAGSVEGRAYVIVPTHSHTFRSGRDGPEPVPLGASSVRVGTTDSLFTTIDSIEVRSWTAISCP